MIDELCVSGLLAYLGLLNLCETDPSGDQVANSRSIKSRIEKRAIFVLLVFMRTTRFGNFFKLNVGLTTVGYQPGPRECRMINLCYQIYLESAIKIPVSGYNLLLR